VTTTVSARLREEPVSWKISSGKAKLVNELPRVEIVCPVQNFQKSLWKHGLTTEEERMGVMISCCLRDG
jgi:hypothetical protein